MSVESFSSTEENTTKQKLHGRKSESDKIGRYFIEAFSHFEKVFYKHTAWLLVLIIGIKGDETNFGLHCLPFQIEWK